MRIALVTSSLTAGGAERVMSLLANHLADQGHEITILSLMGPETDHYPLHSSIRRGVYADPRVSSTAAGRILDNFRRILGLRKTLRREAPHVVLSFMNQTNVTALLATMFSRFPVVVSERISPEHYDIGRMWDTLRKLTYPRSRALVIQTEHTRPWAQRMTSASRVHVVPNPAFSPPPNLPGPPSDSPQPPYVAAMGRLVPQKGFDLLMKAFARLAPSHPHWRLAIMGAGRGEGEHAEKLETMSRELGIQDRVTWCGEVADPFPILAGAEIFALSSRFEGFPNALTEAMACGTPVVAFDCPTGPSDIVRHEEDGLLVPPEDVEGFAHALGRLMDNETERKQMGTRARDVCTRFAPEAVFEIWERILASAARK